MNKVYTLEQAQEWFTKNPSGKVTCVRDGEELTCSFFSEAKAFYTAIESEPEPMKEDESDSGIGLMAGLAIAETFGSEESSPSPDPVPDSSPLETGGGDFGGAGAESDF